jgi:hypothetical protein
VTGYKLDEKAAIQAKKQAEIQAKLLKQSIDNQKKNTAELKKQATLKKAGSIFDLEQVQLIAALKGNLSEEERKRVELQFALLTGNTKEAQLLTYELARAQGLSVAIAKDLASLPQAANPFASWSAYLDDIMVKARAIAMMGSTGGSNYVPPTNASPFTGFSGAASTPGNAAASINVTVNNSGSVISQSDLNDSIVKALQDASLSGLDTSIARNLANFR